MKSVVETLKSKERRGSTGSLEDYKKRKREMSGENGREGRRIFSRRAIGC